MRLVTDIGLNLATTLGYILHLLVDDSRLIFLRKVDEEGVKAEVRVEENRQRVMDVAQEFIDRFTSDEMVEKMPRALRYTFVLIQITNSTEHLKRAIASFTAHFARIHTPDRVLPFLGGFILLRYFFNFEERKRSKDDNFFKILQSSNNYSRIFEYVTRRNFTIKSR